MVLVELLTRRDECLLLEGLCVHKHVERRSAPFDLRRVNPTVSDTFSGFSHLFAFELYIPVLLHTLLYEASLLGGPWHFCPGYCIGLQVLCPKLVKRHIHE